MYVLIFLVILLYGYCSLIYFPVMDYAFPTLGLSILFRSYRFLLSSFYQFLGSTRWSRDKWICSCIRPIRMNERERGGEKKKKKNSRARYIRFLSTRQRAAYVLHEACRFFCALHHEHSPLPLAIPSRFSNHRIIYPSCNERSIRTNTGFLLTESSAQLSKS